MTFHGDSSLANNREQAAFIATVVNRSIEDVFQAYLTSSPGNSFEKSCFYFGSVDATDTVCGAKAANHPNLNPSSRLLRIAQMKYGEFDLSKVSPNLRWFTPLDLLLVSAYTESPTSSESDNGSRNGVAIETMLATYLPGRGKGAPFIFRHLPPAFLLGVSLTRDDGEWLNGGHLRYIFAFPRINTQLSIWSGWQQARFLEAQVGQAPAEVKRWRNISGVRAEMGYGMLFLHVGVERGGSELSIRSGITAMIPRSLWRRN